MFSSLSKASKLYLPIYILLDLFDHMVIPVLLYGSELWGYENTADLERLHLKFCKYILGIKSSTPNIMVYGELGVHPLLGVIKVPTVVIWYKLVECKNSKFSYGIYSVYFFTFTI